MRILGLDFGDKTIGVAISDPFGWTAQGVEIIRRQEPNEYRQSIARLLELADQYQVDAIVLGLPKNMDNSEGARCEKTRAYGEKLQEYFPGTKIIYWDERLSTVAAERMLIASNVTRAKRKKVIDKMAAVHILQGYLNSIQGK